MEIDSQMTEAYLKRNYKISQEFPIEGISFALHESNLFHWKIIIDGPVDSPYEGGGFLLDLKASRNFPFSRPTVQFVTPIYHPNISSKGDVFIDILSHQWTPALSILAVALSIQSLLTDPNCDDPREPEIAKIYLTNRPEYESIAREWTKKYAI